ncbi:MAG: hypothetical protein DMG22_09890 [Acidobacteria bacterium]|nr:MAG: hypothetical protein DMG22_09890 [Acidobacteriota bacterium]
MTVRQLPPAYFYMHPFHPTECKMIARRRERWTTEIEIVELRWASRIDDSFSPRRQRFRSFQVCGEPPKVLISSIHNRAPSIPIAKNCRTCFCRSSPKRDGYRIENVRFQSRPNFWVTGNLYVPATGVGPFPGIISPCGHYSEARIYPAYQFLYLDLVRNGFVVLAYDPIGQGERRHYWNPRTKKSEIGGPVTWEHDMPGHLLLLIGENLTQYRIWDGMRAIDYLLTRPEVDSKRIGCTGQSGGGTLTLFISALDERVRCAVMHEGGTRRRWPLEIRPETPIGTGDVEQHFFPAAIYGIDLPDVHFAIAPRPLLTTIEYYSPDFNETARQIGERYRLLGAPDRFATEEATDPHALTMKLRLATTDWFSRWFYNRRGPEREPGVTPESAETLYCTPNGSLRYSQQGETIFSLILKTQMSLLPPRNFPSSRAELESFRAEISADIAELLHISRNSYALGVRHIVTTPREGYQVEKAEFISEPGIYVPTWVFVPEQQKRESLALLYVHEAGKEAEGMERVVVPHAGAGCNPQRRLCVEPDRRGARRRPADRQGHGRSMVALRRRAGPPHPFRGFGRGTAFLSLSHEGRPISAWS